MPADPLPGDPTPGQLAAADRRHAAVRRAVDQLIADARRDPGTSTEAWIRLAHGPLVDTACRLADQSWGEMDPALLGIAAEAIRRLAGLPVSEEPG